MYKVEGTKITMTRGDTVYINVAITADGEPYTPVEGDSVRFAAKHDKFTPNKTEFIDTDPVIVKSIPTDTMILTIDPEDTSELDFGNYMYDIEITFADGRVDTFIHEAKLIIKPEVH